MKLNELDVTGYTADKLLDLINQTLAGGEAVSIYKSGEKTIFASVDAPK